MRKRTRKIIYNDDGGAMRARVNPLATEGPEGFLTPRFRPCVGTQVTTYFWCLGDGQDPPDGEPYAEEIGDPGQVIIDACRAEDMEVFASLRMGDAHDSFNGVKHPFKLAHPECLLGAKMERPKDSILHYAWAGLNYATREVREYMLSFIREKCEKYDFDGFQMDFSRMGFYFKLGEEEAHVDVMTGFVSAVRELLNDIGSKRGRPYLLAAHVPETPALSRKLGLDVPTWLEKRLLDVMVTGWGYNPFSAKVEESIELGHRYDVPVYVSINCSCIMDKSGHHRERLRGMASTFYRKGADGVYMFNMFVPVDAKTSKAEGVYPALTELGSAETLKGKDTFFGIEPIVKWPHMAYASSTSRLPFSIVVGGPVELFVGDDVEEEARKGNVRELRLMTRVTRLGENERIKLFVNGTPFDESARQKTDQPIVNQYPKYIEKPFFKEGDDFGFVIEFQLNAPPLAAGPNTIQFRPADNCAGAWFSTVQEVWLSVGYRR